MKNGQHMPYDPPPMIFHKIISYFALPVGIAYYIYKIVESFNTYRENSFWFMFDVLPFIVIIALYICAEIAFFKRSRNGVRLLISSNIFGAVSNYTIYLLFLISEESSSIPLNTSMFFSGVLRPIVFAVIFFLYYRKRRAFFYDVQVCLNCGRKVKDIEPECPFCGHPWNVLVPAVEAAPQEPPEVELTPPHSTATTQADEEDQRGIPIWSVGLGLIALDLILRYFGQYDWSAERALRELIINGEKTGELAAAVSAMFGAHVVGAFGIFIFFLGLYRSYKASAARRKDTAPQGQRIPQDQGKTQDQRMPQEQGKRRSPAVSVALGALLVLATLAALYWLVFMSGFVVSNRNTAPVEKISAYAAAAAQGIRG